MTGSMQLNGLTIHWIGHSTVAVYGEKNIYIDPFGQVLQGGETKADLIISSHGHRDHFDPEAINALLRDHTKVVVRPGCEIDKLKTTRVVEMEINTTLDLEGARITSVPAHNVKRFRSPGTPFHPEGFGMGIVLTCQGVKFYYAGDTDFIESMKDLKKEEIDLAFLPIGGTYTMDAEEAAEATAAIAPKQVVPIHYNCIPNTEADPAIFKEKVEALCGAQVVIL